jgi:heme oxygenase
MRSLKDAINEKHRAAENMLFTQQMLNCELSVHEYRVYLYQMYHIFDMIERDDLPHNSLYRTRKVRDDLVELQYNNDFCIDVTNLHLLKSTEEYCNHLQALSPENILPHVYLNYLALLYGGQMMKSKIPGKGKMYDFDNTKDAIEAIRKIQTNEWADEANIGLDFHIAIYDELQKFSR